MKREEKRRENVFFIGALITVLGALLAAATGCMLVEYLGGAVCIITAIIMRSKGDF